MSGAVLGQFLGDESFPIDWESDAESELLWIYDDLHIPQPVSPMFFDIGGGWFSCHHLFRRFAFPLSADLIAQKINRFVYTAALAAVPPVQLGSNLYFPPFRAPLTRGPGDAV